MAVYDQDQRKPNHNPLVPGDDELNRLTGISPDEEGAMEREAYNGAASDIAQREGLKKPLTNEHEDKKSSSPQELKGAEGAAGAAAGGSLAESGKSSSLGGAHAGSGSGFNYHNESKGRLSKAKIKIKGKIKGKKKWLLAGGGLVIFGLILILFLALGSIMIPNFIADTTEYEFARVVRSMTDTDIEVSAEKLDIDASSNALKSQIASTYSGDADNTYSRLDAYRPAKIVDNLEANGQVKYNYKHNGDIKSVEVAGEDYQITPDGFFGKLHPFKIISNKLDAYGAMQDLVTDSARGPTGLLGTVVRGGVGSEIRDRLDIGLVGWAYEKFRGEDPEDADATLIQESESRVLDTGGADTGDSQVNEDDENANNATQEAVNNPQQLAQDVTQNGNGGVPAGTAATIEKDTGGTALEDIADVASGPAALALAVCLVYSGSVQKSGGTVDSQNQELQSEFFATASQADQQEYGNTDGEAVGATNWQLGGATLDSSNAMLLADGETVNTSNTPSPQASSDGQFSYSGSNIFTAIASDVGLGSGAAGVVSSIANNVCPAITSKVALGVLAGVGIASLLSGVGDAAEPAETLVGSLVKSVVDKLTVKGVSGAVADKLAPSSILRELLTPKELAKIGGVVGATVLAKIIVANSSGQAHNGTATGLQYDNEVDMGANLNKNEMERQEFYGRPMTPPETQQTTTDDSQYLVAQFKQQSAYQRYFALSNNQSLISHMAVSLYGTLYSKPIFSTLSSIMSKLFDPISLLPRMFSSLSHSSALAASDNVDTQNYGIVQWGWPPSEENLITSDHSYQPLENAQIFAQEAANYATTHNGCSLQRDIEDAPTQQCPDALYLNQCYQASPYDSYTMGTLLANGSIQRDSNGSVYETLPTPPAPGAADCSPSSLGVNDNFGGESQSVFRWRLMKRYNCTLDNLEEVQNPGQQIATSDDCPTENTTAE